MSDIFKKPSVERLVAGSTYIVGFSVLVGITGWIVTIIGSRSDIGVGPTLYGFLTTATALNIIANCIAGGFNQALSKYISEALVDSKEKALIYAKSGFFIINIFGIILFSIFCGISIWLFPNNFEYGMLFGILAIIYYINFFKNNFVGNLASVHRFDYIGIAFFGGGIAGAGLAFGILFFVPKPLNAILLPLMLLMSIGVQIIIIFHFSRKSVPYSLRSVFRGASRTETFQILKYGLYCMIPNIIFTGAILWIQTLWFSGLIGIATTVVSANGIIIGYASVALAICQIGWPQIPAISEAKAMNDYKIIDEYMKNTLHNGYNMTVFLLTIYIGLSYIILALFHGTEYLFAHIPFIILSTAVAILGVEFLICSLLLGLGEGKKAAILISVLTLIQIFTVPILIIFLNGAFGTEVALYAGPSSLLISSIAIFPITFYYLLKYTKNPKRVYLGILGKALTSMILTLLCFSLIEFFVFPHSSAIIAMIIGMFVRGVLLFGFFVLFMLIFAGLNDADLDLYSKYMGPLQIMIKGMRWLLHHSPFYEKDE
ncbi:MAG: hypothetical protein ACFFD2_07415 [Promethearchaeota archaeon]